MSAAPPAELALFARLTRFLVIGSQAVALQRPDLLRAPPSDTDLLVEPSALNQLAARLQIAGFALTIWDAAMRPPFSARQLRGRWYVRARRDRVTIDLTYECPWLDFATSWARRVVVGGVPTAHLDDVAALIAQRDRPGDAEYAALLRAQSQ